jgi:aspartyl-tRNA synthetase
MKYDYAIENYGIDRPDTRFGMTFKYIKDEVMGKAFKVFDEAENVIGIVCPNCSEYTRKQLDDINAWLQRPQIGAKGAVWIKYNNDGTLKSSVDKFYSEDELRKIADKMQAQKGDLMLILAGKTTKTRSQLCELRLFMGEQLGLRNKNVYKPLWIIDFPLVEWDEDTQRYYACHHPFTSPKVEDIPLMETNPAAIRANAYDLVMNGTELGGGSIRIHDKNLQSKYFDLLGFTKEEAKNQFGFLLDAFEYGAPPHGGLAFGLDRLVAMIGGADSIRDFIPFPKNNAGRDVMLDSPSIIKDEQMKELCIQSTWKG